MSPIIPTLWIAARHYAGELIARGPWQVELVESGHLPGVLSLASLEGKAKKHAYTYAAARDRIVRLVWDAYRVTGDGLVRVHTAAGVRLCRVWRDAAGTRVQLAIGDTPRGAVCAHAHARALGYDHGLAGVHPGPCGMPYDLAGHWVGGSPYLGGWLGGRVDALGLGDASDTWPVHGPLSRSRQREIMRRLDLHSVLDRSAA